MMLSERDDVDGLPIHDTLEAVEESEDERASDGDKQSCADSPTEFRYDEVRELTDLEPEANEQNEADRGFEDLDDHASSYKFVAAWIRTNFPDVKCELEFQAQMSSFEQAENAELTMDLTASTKPDEGLCEECGSFSAVFVCENCTFALCYRCTDAIHIIPSLSEHSIRFGRLSSANQALGAELETRFEQPDHVLILSSQPTTTRLSLPTGTHIFFRAVDCARWSRELLHGTLVSGEPATSSNRRFYHRVLWLRGVEALPNGFFRASLTLPGWDISTDSDEDVGETFWPHEIGVFPTQLGALRAVVTAEQIARDKFRRELAGGRIHRWRSGSDNKHTPEDDEIGQEAFPSSEILDEIGYETAATLSSEFGVRLTHQDDVRFHQELVQGTWHFHKWMETIGRTENLREEDAVPFEDGVGARDTTLDAEAFDDELEAPVPTPWAPASRIRFFMIAQHELVFPERICRQHLRAILEQLLFVYAGYAWKLWHAFVERHRTREDQQKRARAVSVLQSWAGRIAERRRQQERQLLLSMAIGSPVNALEMYRRQQIEARKLYTVLTRQIEQRKRNALKTWRVAVGPSAPPPPPAISWHPSHGMKAMLPKLPRMGARRRMVQDTSVAPGTQVIIEDMATYKLFRANHTGPADTSYWVIRARVLAGACPIGPAFREARRLVSRTDFATSVLLQQISVFVCLMEPKELKNLEMTEGGSGADTEWSYERQVRTKYKALCSELRGAETISKRHVELAQKLLVDFDGEAAQAAATAMGGSGTRNSKQRRSSMTSQQQQQEDAAEEAKMNEARDALEQKLQLAEQQATKASHEVARLGMMQLEFLYFPISHDGVPATDELMTFLQERIEARLRAGKNLYIFSRLGHGRTGLVSALLLGRVYGITASEALERVQRTHDCQRPGAPRGLSFCSPTTAPQIAFVRRALARSMDPIYVPLVLENSAEGFRSTRMQQRGVLAEPFLKDEGFMISTAGDGQAREREALEQKRLERIARRESTAAKLQRERQKQQHDHEIMEAEEYAQAAREVMASIYDKIVEDP